MRVFGRYRLLRKTFASPRSLRLPALAALAAGSFALPSHAMATCTPGSTLPGYYGVLITGINSAGVGKNLSGKLVLDGACGITGQLTTGEPNAPQQIGALVTGSYAGNADHSVSLTLSIPNVTAPETYVVGFSNLFGEALGVETDSAAVATIDMKPMTFPNPGTVRSWDIYAIAGTYVASCYGPGGFSDLNSFTIVPPPAGGIGTITGVDNSNDGGHFLNQPYAGAIGVQFDGRVYGYVTVPGATYGFTGVADNNAKELQYVYTFNTAAAPTIEYCTAKRVS